jgi:hypothetical protein
MLEVHATRPDSFIISPSLAILGGMLRKLTGVDPATLGQKQFEDRCLENRMATPIKARNLLAAGQLDPLPGMWQFDEAHHTLADTYLLISVMCPGRKVGWTATPFRGSPGATIAWRKLWDEIVPVLTYPEAAAGGFIAIPTPSVQPLADDDQLAIANGDFTVTSAAELMYSRLDDLIEISRPWHCTGTWDRVTGYVLPGVEIARDLTARLTAAGLPAILIDADTPWAERQTVLAANLRREVAIVSIGVLAEGVDHAFRRLVDCAPTMSPVKALQVWGRVMRPVAPGEPSPELICCNRNVERHLYLLSGCWPPAVLTQAQKAFGNVSKRIGARVLGLEALGRLKAAELPLADSSRGLMWCFAAAEGLGVRQYAVLLHPASSEPVVATRVNGDGGYGRWEPCDLPELEGGWASVSPAVLTEKQRNWWQRAAARYGLDPHYEPDRRQFAALPVLANLNLRLVTVA